MEYLRFGQRTMEFHEPAQRQLLQPVGTIASANTERWNTDGAKAYSEIVDQIGSLPLGDPSIPGLVAQAYKYIC